MLIFQWERFFFLDLYALGFGIDTQISQDVFYVIKRNKVAYRQTIKI